MHGNQSAARHVLAKLRTQFDDPLFVKTRVGMEPIPTMLALMPNLDLACNKVKLFSPATEATTLYIGAIDDVEFYVLRQLVSRL